MKTEKKIIKQKMSVLELAQTLHNITDACRRKGVSRTQFYEWKRRFQTHGLEGLRDLPPIEPTSEDRKPTALSNALTGQFWTSFSESHFGRSFTNRLSNCKLI